MAERWVKATQHDGRAVWINMALVEEIYSWDGERAHVNGTTFREPPEHFLPAPRVPSEEESYEAILEMLKRADARYG